MLGRLAAEFRKSAVPLQVITWPSSAQGDFELHDHRIALQRACESSTERPHPADQLLALQVQLDRSALPRNADLQHAQA
jgi:hypothetical protein